MPHVTEFVYFTPKSSVKPEDPKNEEGAALLEVFKTVKQQSGYLGSAWGRTKEDDKALIWAIDWEDSHSGISNQTSPLTPYLEPDTNITKLFTTLSPTDDDNPATQTLLSNPITELAPLPFPSILSNDDRSAVSAAIVSLRKACHEENEEKVRCKTFMIGQIERPGELEHEKAEGGKVFVHLLVAGWKDVDQHMGARETEGFKKSIGPIRERMAPPMEKLGMRHVKFQEV
ncbi:uncharacterized protein BDV14DRAFT_161738 [Aspergillus stella-maris]|uniref:uncharacterized protein n=1 Tax=Aspergillus stella-maris TaxID=1810926 RepID=UPI003CCDBA79